MKLSRMDVGNIFLWYILKTLHTSDIFILVRFYAVLLKRIIIMKKHILNISTLLLLFTSYGWAQNASISPARMITYRIGGGLAGEYASIDADVINRPDVVFPGDGDFSSNTHHSCRKFQMSPNAEFGAFLYDKYYLGFSLSKHYTHAQSSLRVPMTTLYYFKHKFRLESYVDAFLKFGYKPMSNLMFFGLVGPSFADWSHKTKVFYYDKGLDDDLSSTKNLKKSKTNVKTTGLGFGGGMEYWVTKNATVSFQYALHLHPTKNIRYDSEYTQLSLNDIGHGDLVDRNSSVKKNVRLTYSTIGLRFSYFFSF